jgi:hypothetical protein
MGWPRTEHSREAEAEGSRNSRTSAIDRRWSIASPTTKRLHSRLPVPVPRPYWNFNVQGVATSSSPGVASIHIPHLHTIHSVVTALICHPQCNASYLKKHRPQRPGVLQDHWPSDDESVIKDP